MTLVEAIEIAKFAPDKRTLYLRVVLVSLLASLLWSTAYFSGWTSWPYTRGRAVDFDDFHLVARLLWFGQIRGAYHLPTLVAFQESLSGLKGQLPWAYPPQFALLLAPLAFLPLSAAYMLFTGASLAAFLAVLKRIAGTSFVPVLMVFFPAFVVNIRVGQNGFLTGTLIGLTCLGFMNRGFMAGIPLGLMAIKPHLAAAFALYSIVNRRWGVFIASAATVVLSTSMVTAILGFGIWPVFFSSIREVSTLLSQGLFPLYRMVSLYAAIRSLGFPVGVAMPTQLLTGGLALVALVWASWRLSSRQALGIAAMTSLLVSPYVYDYDMPIFAIGLALLHDDIVRFATERERLAIYGLIAFSSGFGLVRTVGRAFLPGTPLWSISGFTLFAAALLIFRSTLRSAACATSEAFAAQVVTASV